MCLPVKAGFGHQAVFGRGCEYLCDVWQGVTVVIACCRLNFVCDRIKWDVPNAAAAGEAHVRSADIACEASGVAAVHDPDDVEGGRFGQQGA